MAASAQRPVSAAGKAAQLAVPRGASEALHSGVTGAPSPELFVASV